MKEEGIDKYRIRGMFNLEDLCAENFRDIFLEYLNLFAESFYYDTLEFEGDEKFEGIEIDEFRNTLIQYYDEDNKELIEILANSLGAGNGTADFFKIFSGHNYGYKDWQEEHPNFESQIYFDCFDGYLYNFDVYILRTQKIFYVVILPNYKPRDEYEFHPIEIDVKNLKQQIEKELKKIDEEYN